MTIYERRKKHLDSRLAVYLADPKQRAANPGEMPSCLYRASGGRKCFIGQDIPDEVYKASFEQMSISQVINMLPVDIQELGDLFLHRCQQLHDNYVNWTDEGLSDMGRLDYNDIVSIFCTPC